MKIGDLVKMDLPLLDEEADEWGLGIVVEAAGTRPEGSACVLWSKTSQESWELYRNLEQVDESR